MDNEARALVAQLQAVTGTIAADDPCQAPGRSGGYALAPVARPLAEGDQVYVHAFGAYRRGLVTKVGPKRATVAYVTRSNPFRVYSKAVAFADVFTVGGK